MSSPSERECLAAAVTLLAGRAYSEDELANRLVAKGQEPQIVEQVMTELRRRGYLDDEALCQRLFKKYAASGKYGVNAIVARLQQRRLPRQVIQETVREYDRLQGCQTALELVKRRFRTPSPTDTAKIARFLVSRGFTTDIITKVLAQFDQSFIDSM